MLIGHCGLVRREQKFSTSAELQLKSPVEFATTAAYETNKKAQLCEGGVNIMFLCM